MKIYLYASDKRVSWNHLESACYQVIWVLQIKDIYTFVSYKNEIFVPTL